MQDKKRYFIEFLHQLKESINQLKKNIVDILLSNFVGMKIAKSETLN